MWLLIALTCLGSSGNEPCKMLPVSEWSSLDLCWEAKASHDHSECVDIDVYRNRFNG